MKVETFYIELCYILLYPLLKIPKSCWLSLRYHFKSTFCKKERLKRTVPPARPPDFLIYLETLVS